MNYEQQLYKSPNTNILRFMPNTSNKYAKYYLITTLWTWNNNILAIIWVDYYSMVDSPHS
jgi:hypothetical protein